MSVFYVLGVLFALGINLLFSWKYGISRLRAGLYTLCFFYGVAGALLAGTAYQAFCVARGDPMPLSRVAMFGAVVFTPPLTILTVLAEKGIRRILSAKTGKPHARISVRDTIDLETPDIFIVLAFAKLNCHFDGCCYGIPAGRGVYSAYLKTTVFPVQIAEVLAILAILVLCYFLKQRPFYRRGMAYPLTAGLYCAARFGLEYLRYYPEDLRGVCLGMTVWQACSLAVLLASAVSLVLLYRREPAAPLSGKLLRPRETAAQHKKRIKKR